MTEDIITDLSRYRDLDVMARNATAAYAGKPVDIRAVGKALNVRYVLEGSIQKHNEQVRVTAQLIEADRGTHLWSERWDRPATDVFAVQAEVAEQVATRLAASGGAIPEAERAASRRARPEDLKAYDLYRMGQEAMGQLHQGEHRGGHPLARAGGRPGSETRPRLGGAGRRARPDDALWRGCRHRAGSRDAGDHGVASNSIPWMRPRMPPLAISSEWPATCRGRKPSSRRRCG